MKYRHIPIAVFVALSVIIITLQFKPHGSAPRKPVRKKAPASWMVMTPGAKPCHVHPVTLEEAMAVAPAIVRRQVPAFDNIKVVAPCQPMDSKQDGVEGWICESTGEIGGVPYQIGGIVVAGHACDHD